MGVRSPLDVNGAYVPAMGLGSIAVSPLDIGSGYLERRQVDRLEQQVRRPGQILAQIAEIGMNAKLPCVAKGLDLLRLTGDVIGAAILHVTPAR